MSQTNSGLMLGGYYDYQPPIRILIRCQLRVESTVQWLSHGSGVKLLLDRKLMKVLSVAFLSLLLFGSTNWQAPPIGIVDFYGLRSLTERRARAALPIKEGDVGNPLPHAAQKETQRRLEALLNVEQALLNFVCCDAGKVILYVGIRERGAPTLQFRPAPKGAIRLPETIVLAGEEFQNALTEAVLRGNAGEDDSKGHALSSNPKLRAIQDRFITFASQDLPLLRAVLHESSDAGHRSLATQIIAYAANKRGIIKDLVYGMSDFDGGVRNDSMRGLDVLVVFAKNSPRQRINIPVQPFVEMLDSIEWTDRNKSSFALYRLTEKRDPAILSSLRKRSLSSLVEMARWKSPGHAMPAFTLLGRVGKFSEEEIQRAWDIGDRESIIAAVFKGMVKIPR